MKNLLKVFSFDDTSSFSDNSKIFARNHAVTLISGRAVEHTYSTEGLATITAPKTITFGSAFVKNSDRLKFISIPNTETNQGLFKIKTVSSTTQVEVTPPNLVNDASSQWSLLAYKSQYPLDLDLTVSTPLWTPEALKGLTGFSMEAETPDGTSVDFRLYDGTNNYYWDGGSWAVASTSSHWSSETDVDANISSFDVSALTVEVIARLKTTDPDVTPTLYAIGLRWQSQFSNHMDLYDSILRYLKEIDAVDFVQDDITSVSSFALSSWLDQNQDVIDVIAAYNLTDDPTTDILSSYSGGVVTFTSAQTGTVRIFFSYKPNVRDWVHQDMLNIEADPAPCIVLENADEVQRVKLGGEIQSGNYDFNYPEQCDIEVKFTLMTKAMRTLTYLGDALEEKLATDSLMTLFAIGEEVTIRNITGLREVTRPSFSDLREGVISARIYFHPRYYDNPVLSYKITSLLARANKT